MIKTQTLIISGELMDLNTYINIERANKFGAASIKDVETSRVANYCRQQKFKIITKPEVVFFRWFNKDKRKDFDNIEFAQKFIWDGLVQAGILPNDGQKDTPVKRVHMHFVDKKNPRVEIDFAKFN